MKREEKEEKTRFPIVVVRIAKLPLKSGWQHKKVEMVEITTHEGRDCVMIRVGMRYADRE